MDTFFLPITWMLQRVESSKDESDSSFFMDLLLLGEMVTKTIAVFLASNIEDDVDRNRYRFEYKIVHIGGIGDFSEIISSMMTGNVVNSICQEVVDNEVKELNAKASVGSWQFEALNELSSCLQELDIQANRITTKSSLLIWFSNFALLRNKTRGHGAKNSGALGRVSGYLYDSILTIITNFTMFKRQWAYLRQNMNLSYRVIPLSNSCENFSPYKKKNYPESLPEGVYCFSDKARHVSLVFSTEDANVFYLPNGGFNEKEYEVLDYRSGNSRRLDASSYRLSPTVLPLSVTTGKKQLDSFEGVFSNIPATSNDYIHRSLLEEELSRVLLEEDRFPIITLKGRGGIGKTSLAIQVIHDIVKNERFDLIVWFSARDMDLMIDGAKQVQAAVINPTDIAKEYYRLIAPDEKTPKDVVDFFTRELSLTSYGKTLYVFDNFETFTNPTEIYEWLNNSIRNPNKILITSRLNRNFKADYPVEVGGMSESECRQLIKNYSIRYSIDSLLTEEYIKRLIDESDGHPYIIKIILGEVAKNRRVSDIKRIVADKDSILDALFKRTFSTFSSASKRVFLTLCSWNSVVSLLALESVLLREENERIDIDHSIEELSRSSFIELIGDGVETFISVPLAAAIFGKKELEVSPDKMAIMEDRKLLMEFGAGNTRGLLTLGTHINRKFREVKNRVGMDYSAFEKEIPMLEMLASKYPKAWLLLADLYRGFNNLNAEAEACREFLKTQPSEDDRVSCWRRVQIICQQLGDWNGECSAIVELAKIASTPYDVLSTLAARLIDNTNRASEDEISLKRSYILSVVSALEGRFSEANGTDCSRLAWLYLVLQDESKALRYAQIGFEKEPDNVHCQRLIDKLQNR